jgi:membrane-associated protease RseP (regulator of RpoE activity)
LWAPAPGWWGDGVRIEASPYAWRLRLDNFDAMLGAMVAPADDVLRSQLELPAGQGLVVSRLLPGGAAAEGGVQEHDILLTANGRPLSSARDLREAFKAAKGEAVALEALRGGERVKLSVRPVAAKGPRTFRFRWSAETPYWIGVVMGSVDEALRAQLDLPEGAGVVVMEVVPDSPADHVGLQQHDVVLSVNDKPIKDPEDLRAAVVGSQGEELTIRFLRGGKELTVKVVPAKRELRAGDLLRPWEGVLEFYGPHPGVAVPGTPPREGVKRGLDAQIRRMENQVEQLRRMIDSLKERVPGKDDEPERAEPPQDKGEPKEKTNI